MNKSLAEKIALSFLKALVSTLVVVIIGISVQPTLRGAIAVYVGALVAGIAAGIGAIQMYVPQLSFRRWIGDPYGQMIDTFSHGFLAAFLVSVAGFLHQQDLSTWKAALTAAFIGAISAGLRFGQNALTPGSAPFPARGVLLPEPVSVPASDPQPPAPVPAPTPVTAPPVAPQPPPPDPKTP